jgi:haloalkane dehalogenase
MWAPVVERAAQAGWHALAPDLPGYGDSPPDPPHTWQRMVDVVARFHVERAGGPVALCVHDWGGLIGLRWACEHPEHVRALVISATGFFPDGKWHGLAKALRTEGEGEQIVDGTTRQAFGQMLAAVAPGITEESCDEYFKAYADPVRRPRPARALPVGRLRAARALSAAGWPRSTSRRSCSSLRGPVRPRRLGHRLAREIPNARTEILDGVGHFMFDEVPARAAGIVVDFLRELD